MRSRASRAIARFPRLRAAMAERPALVLVPAEASLAVVVVLAVLGHHAWAAAATGAVVLVGVLGLAPVVQGRTPIEHLRLRREFARRARRQTDAHHQAPELAALAEWVPSLAVTEARSVQGLDLGVVSDDRGWVVLLAPTSDDDVIASPLPTIDLPTIDLPTIDLSALAPAVGADDLTFAGVQLVTFVVPATGVRPLGCPATESYRQLLDPPPPVVRRSVIAVRLDPSQCLPAVLRRGSTPAGINATIGFAVHRVRAQLKRQGIETRALGAAEAREVVAMVIGCDCTSPGRTVESWTSWSCAGIAQVAREATIGGAGAQPAAHAALVDAVCDAPALFAVVATTLDPEGNARGGVRLGVRTPEGVTAAGAWLDDDLPSMVRPWTTLHPGAGRQVPALVATMPLGRGARA